MAKRNNIKWSELLKDDVLVSTAAEPSVMTIVQLNNTSYSHLALFVDANEAKVIKVRNDASFIRETLWVVFR